jgi:hypothetical protein
MEGLIQRTFVIGAVFAIAGAWFTFGTKIRDDKKTEDQLIEWAPTRVAGMDFVPGPDDPRVSGRQPEVVYNTLKPFGIVQRMYSDGKTEYDAVVIASRSKDSFHDPRVCFSAQGWTIEKFDPSFVATKSRGNVPITMIQMSSDRARHKMAAFFYKGPGGKFYGTTQTFKMSLFTEILKLGQDIDGVFYRFIPVSGDPTEEQFKQFIADYLDAAKVSSNEYF